MRHIGEHTSDMLRRMIRGEWRTPEQLAEAKAEWEKAEAERLAAHEARQAEEWPRFLAKLDVPDMAQAALARPDALAPTLALDAAQRFLTSRRRFLVLTGGTGAGKTVGGCFCLRASRRRVPGEDAMLEWWEEGAMFVRLATLLRVSDFNPEDQRTFSRACSREVLVLDEVGGRPGESLTPRQHGLLEELVDRRDVRGFRTVLTTNLSLRSDAEGAPSPFATFVQEKVASRMSASLVAQDCGREDLRRRRQP